MPEEFNPELIKVETLEEAKKKIYDLYQDIKKTKEKDKSEIETLKEQLNQFNEKLGELKTKETEVKNEAEAKIIEELEKQKEYVKINERLKAKLEDYEKQTKTYSEQLNQYKEMELKQKEAEAKKRNELLEKIKDESLKELYKNDNIPLILIEREIKNQEKNNGTSQITEPDVKQKEDAKMASEKLRETPARVFAENLVENVLKL